jgi:hypothetical protein
MVPSDAEMAAHEARLAHVLERRKAGADYETIIAELVKEGMDEHDAVALAREADTEGMNALWVGVYGPFHVVGGLIGGLLGAVIGAAAWAGLARLTGREFTIVAVGMGFLVGFGVYFVAGRKRGRSLQVVAVASALFGILLAKYAIFCLLLKDELSVGGAAAHLSPFSATTLRIFIRSLPGLFGLFDLLWIGVAVFIAWLAPERRPFGSRRQEPATHSLG